MKYLVLVCICFLCALQVTLQFKLKGNSVEKQTLLAGSSLELKCKTDSNWEYCTWKHVQGDIEDGHVRECHMEWKWMKGGASIEKCDEELSGRVSIIGNYENNECGLKILDAVPKDSGKWKCEVEEYIFVGSKGSGPSVTHEFDIDIIEESHQSHPESHETENEPVGHESEPESHVSIPESHESEPKSQEREIVEDKTEEVGEFSDKSFTEAETKPFEDVTEPVVTSADDVMDLDSEHTIITTSRTVQDLEENTHSSVSDLGDDNVSKLVETNVTGEDQLDMDPSQNYNLNDYENAKLTNNTFNQNDLVDKNGVTLEDSQGVGVMVAMVILGGVVLLGAVALITFLTKKKYSSLSQHKHARFTKDQIVVVVGESEEPSFQKLLETDKI